MVPDRPLPCIESPRPDLLVHFAQPACPQKKLVLQRKIGNERQPFTEREAVNYITQNTHTFIGQTVYLQFHSTCRNHIFFIQHLRFQKKFFSSFNFFFSSGIAQIIYGKQEYLSHHIANYLLNPMSSLQLHNCSCTICRSSDHLVLSETTDRNRKPSFRKMSVDISLVLMGAKTMHLSIQWTCCAYP